MFYALYDYQTSRIMSTGRNTTSIQDLAKEFRDYIAIDHDEEEDADVFGILNGDDEKRIKSLIYAYDFQVLDSTSPFAED